MNKRMLRGICTIVCLFFTASLFHAPIAFAAKTQAVPMVIAGQKVNVTPGQWVTVKNASGGVDYYKVHFANGKPVALDMQQHTQLIFGDGAVVPPPDAGINPPPVSEPVVQSTTPAAQTTNSNVVVRYKDANTGRFISKAQAEANPSSAIRIETPKKGAAPVNNSTSSQAQAPAKAPANAAASPAPSASSAQAPASSDVVVRYKDANTGRFISKAQAEANPSSAVRIETPKKGSAAASKPSTNSSAPANKASSPAPSTSGAENISASTAEAPAQTTSSKKNWSPNSHPRDPQTGKFISREEALARGIISEDASQVAQSSQTNQGGESVNAAQAAAGESASGAKGGKSKPTIGDKFKSGYQTTKNMTQQGFQNVKDSVKSGFSAKNILVTAGITVGVDLATQVMRGENPSLKSALKTVCCAEFVGSVAGSTLGAAAGSFTVPFLNAIPVVGGVLSALAPTMGSIVGSSMGAYLAGDLKNGRFSIKEAFKRIDWVGVTGQAIGSTAGAALGSFLGPVGSVLGGMIGGYLGNWAAQKIAGFFSKKKPAELPLIGMASDGNGQEYVDISSVEIDDSGSYDDAQNSGYGNEDEVVIVEDETESVTNTDASANDLYENYYALYEKYNDLVQEGRMDEAMTVAQDMNKAKAAYDAMLSGQ